jgi:carbon monoxide dehydrogenase subunit G
MIAALLLNLVVMQAFSEGVKTPYTDRVQALVSDEKPAPASFLLKCWTDPKNDLYMGVEQRLKIHAPLAAVTAVLDAVDEYDELFPGFKKINLVSKSENHFVVHFEQVVPVFFIPNIKYEMLYTELTPNPQKKIYEYQLKTAGTIKSSDGLIILTQNEDNATTYTEYDFFDAEWGAAKFAGKTKLWHDSVEGIYFSDLAIKLKSEDPKLKPQMARELAKKSAEGSLVDTCVKNRSEWPKDWAPQAQSTPH